MLQSQGSGTRRRFITGTLAAGVGAGEPGEWPQQRVGLGGLLQVVRVEEGVGLVGLLQVVRVEEGVGLGGLLQVVRVEEGVGLVGLFQVVRVEVGLLHVVREEGAGLVGLTLACCHHVV